MTEILTESFCERCGTRYTFETVAPRQKKLGGLKVLGRGLKTFVLSDDTSLDEAMASARSDEEREMTGRQLDAFHKTFNFCMNCRQYTCANCWNPIEARCLSCAPRADQVIGEPALQLASSGADVDALLSEPDLSMPVAESVPALPVMDAADILGRLDAAPTESAAPTEAELAAVFEPPAATRAEERESVPAAEYEREHVDDHVHDHEHDHEAVALTNGLEPDLEGLLAASAKGAAEAREAPAPAFELATPAAAETADEDLSPAAALFEAAAAEAAEAAEVAEATPTADAVEALEAVSEAEPDVRPVVRSVDDRARDASAATGALLSRFRPGQSLDAEIEAYEASLSGEPAAEPEPGMAAATPEPEPEMAPATPEPEPEPVAAATSEPEPVAAAALEPEPGAAVELLVEPEAPAPRRDIVEQPAWPRPETPPAAPGAEPEWPTGPRWPTAIPMRPEAAPPPPPPAVPPPFPTPAATAPAAEADPLAFLTARRAGEAMWAASAQDVVAAATRPGENIPTTVRSCVSCGLSLSATARFCRRCGTRQSEG